MTDDIARVEAGRQLGHDLYCHSRLARDPGWSEAVTEGFDSAEARGQMRQAGDRFVRKWLQLRASALRRDRIVDADVTPDFLRRLDVAECPVLRIRLTHGEQSDTDWSVDRLNNDGAYAPRNLAIISTRVNCAKADFDFAAVHARACGQVPARDLAPAQWMRLAVLMLGPCHAEQPSAAPVLPLLAPLPNLTARPANQMIQYVLTMHTQVAAERNLVVKQFNRCCLDSHARAHCRQLAEHIHFALKETPVCWDVWLLPRVMQTFLAWRTSVPDRHWAAIGAEAMVLAGGQRVERSALAGWHLASRGHFGNSWRR
ncbi:MAG: hypothetical protein M3Y65_09945 [Pseudomonadota bacterium]|nr:hypothetical protein [Pseudomonadota bacterium]